VNNTYISIPITGITKKETPPTRTYALDLDKGRIEGFVDGLEACQQFIRKALITPRFRCLIYNNQYGSEIKQAITTEDASPAYVAAELPRIVKDAIINDDRIIDVDTSAFTFEFVEDGVYVDFDVQTIYGNLKVQEVLSGVV